MRAPTTAEASPNIHGPGGGLVLMFGHASLDRVPPFAVMPPTTDPAGPSTTEPDDRDRLERTAG
jgi:hypothetical protein